MIALALCVGCGGRSYDIKRHYVVTFTDGSKKTIIHIGPTEFASDDINMCELENGCVEYRPIRKGLGKKICGIRSIMFSHTTKM